MSTKIKFIDTYLSSISQKYTYEETSEMGYRTDFELLLKNIFEDVVAFPRIDHDAKATDGNKPDFVIRMYNIPILYIETKNIGANLDRIEKSDQMARYFGYANLVLTDYLEFRFYRNGVRYEEPIIIGEQDENSRSIILKPQQYNHLAKSLIDFCKSHKEPIKSGEHLSKIMGGKARRIRDNIKQFLSIPSEKNNEIFKIYGAIKEQLVHDLTLDSFADMYSQTLVYGLFVARYHDETPKDFSRREAGELVPRSNPLLRNFFNHIAGPDFDKRLDHIVNELCTVFSHANIPELMKQYFKDDLWGNTTESPDPVIHFYEDFLKEYDPELRKKMGAFYTPLPIVRFIVRSLDDILKVNFGLHEGLGDTSKSSDGTHKVQILDPAVGTGTFISAIIRIIYSRMLKRGQKGRWPSYVHHDLLPRLHGFELMMAPYTIAHLKLSMAFKETGFWKFHNRLGIYLTNSLEEGTIVKDLFGRLGFAETIATESHEAAIIKNTTPIMVIVGNPPYSGISSNETKYANGLVKKYKVEPGGKTKLKEKKHWLHDDYVKFIAFSEDFIKKNKSGIIGFITNHGYLNNPTFRGMRWQLLDTFDIIYVIDLHGNSNKKEKSPDGSKDENVFDIQQGVAILLGIKTGKKKVGDLAKIFHLEFWGKRTEKFIALNNLSIADESWHEIKPELPNLFFIPNKSISKSVAKDKGFKIDDLFLHYTSGIVTMGDGFIVANDKDVLLKRLNNFFENDVSEIELKKEFKLGKNYAGWILENKTKIDFKESNLVSYLYRPFDYRYTYFDNKLIWRPRTKIMQNFMYGDNLGLIAPKQLAPSEKAGAFITRIIGGHKTFSAFNSNYYFPLYVYSKTGERLANLNVEILSEIEKVVGEISPEEVLDYIYGLMYSKDYLSKNQELLKSNFPRIPLPPSKDFFNKISSLGTELRSIHLLESPKLNEYITTYPMEGDNYIKRIEYKSDKILINDEQYFGDVPESIWTLLFGGFYPAQKWLQDRIGRELMNEDIQHYQKIIVALAETDRIMKEIDNIEFE